MKRDRMGRWLGGALVCTVLVGCQSSTPDPRILSVPGVHEELESFYRNTRVAMNRAPMKRDGTGMPIAHAENFMGDEPLSGAELWRAKDEMRARLMDRASEDDKQSGATDPVAALVGIPNLFRTPQAMEDAHMTAVTVARVPWSDSYWPLQHGLIGARYADHAFPNSRSWQTNLAFIQGHPFMDEIAAGREANLSPSEKYDALVGDASGLLTREVWDAARARGSVAGWEGICDGWSAAAVSYDEPLRTVTTTTPDGKSLHFYPSDIKGLSSLLWAKSAYSIKLIGTRCDEARPRRDENGRVISDTCRGTNAGSWHLAVVNQLGQGQRPLIIDANLDYEIWNFPVWKFSYTYFNPQSLQPVNYWRDATIPMAAFTIDRFQRYRSPNAAYIVGVAMDLTYSIEVTPTHSEGGSTATRQVRYLYDLELDAGMNIIGGEWYSALHPDFMWSPTVGSKASSMGDSHIADPTAWTGTGPLPADWMEAAKVSSPHLQPLPAVVQKLVQLARP